MKRVMLGTIVFLKSPIQVVDLLTSFTSQTKPPGRNGFTLAEIRQRIKLMDRFEEHKDKPYVDLEDAEWQVLKDVMSNAEFTVADKGAIELVDRVLKAAAPPKPEAAKSVSSKPG